MGNTGVGLHYNCGHEHAFAATAVVLVWWDCYTRHPRKPFTALGCPVELARRLAALSYHVPTRVQAAALPTIFAGRDVVVTAETGCGKTMLYVLPIVASQLRCRGSAPAASGFPPRASTPVRASVQGVTATAAAGADAALPPCGDSVVLVPSQELARQVVAVFDSVGDGLGVSARNLCRSSVSGQSAQVLVGTPHTVHQVREEGGRRLFARHCLCATLMDTHPPPPPPYIPNTRGLTSRQYRVVACLMYSFPLTQHDTAHSVTRLLFRVTRMCRRRCLVAVDPSASSLWTSSTSCAATRSLMM